ncbi:hypothetical protein M2399_002933 [Pseudomonas sp. BIGb0450]|nr:hypothetical protein [Pseudomonas sp. BIGb0558]MCS3437491.1 hypothetical protein [Pseudomonas sp. BIGb0450]
MWEPGLCGSWLACDGITAVWLTDRGACIAGKPGSHKSLAPTFFDLLRLGYLRAASHDLSNSL